MKTIKQAFYEGVAIGVTGTLAGLAYVGIGYLLFFN